MKPKLVKNHINQVGGKTELTTIKTLMEITGQNKEDVQSVLRNSATRRRGVSRVGVNVQYV